jgi:hypothetical protein
LPDAFGNVACVTFPGNLHPSAASPATRPREATSNEVKGLRAEARQLKEALAEVTFENRLLKKSVIGDGEDLA